MYCPACGGRMLFAFDVGYYWFCFPCGLRCRDLDCKRGGGVIMA